MTSKSLTLSQLLATGRQQGESENPGNAMFLSSLPRPAREQTT